MLGFTSSILEPLASSRIALDIAPPRSEEAICPEVDSALTENVPLFFKYDLARMAPALASPLSESAECPTAIQLNPGRYWNRIATPTGADPPTTIDAP